VDNEFESLPYEEKVRIHTLADKIAGKEIRKLARYKRLAAMDKEWQKSRPGFGFSSSPYYEKMVEIYNDYFDKAVNWVMKQNPFGHSSQVPCDICGEVIRVGPEEYKSESLLKHIRKAHGYKNPVSRLYQRFHGVPPRTKRIVKFNNPKGPLIKIGNVSRIDYVPGENSHHRGINFYHHLGDTGDRKLRTNWILATDESGKNFYLLKDNPKSSYPVFTERGIIG